MRVIGRRVYGHVKLSFYKNGSTNMLSKYSLLILEARLKSKLLAAGNKCLYLL